MLIYNPPHGKSIRVPKTFVTFEKLLPFGQWVFDKSRVQKKSSAIRGRIQIIIRVQKHSCYSRNSCSKKKSVFIHPRANEQSYFRIFLPFFITTPACRLPLMAQPERSYSLPSIAFVVRTDVMPDFMSSGISLFSNISVPFS